MDYNTQRTKLLLPEYGRCIQDMVEYAMTIDDRKERQRCAFTIIDLMANMQAYSGNEDDFYQKLWNHLAYISSYKLDIDYPVEIQRIDKQEKKRERVPYPQKNISRRHYGAIIEQLTHRLNDMEPGEERDNLTRLVANQMKRNLASWNSNALDDEKILEDLAEYTDGKISLLPNEIELISDREALADVWQQGASKKKKKK
ncbi:MAG: DUF4290 domain-containing protein [Bacteroidaceae bacterium]|nr:DUF4290 domain-containing protein [Bacteroidaceae bacterium]MBQ9176648.1 DUF4290 domain-containing protein [Bacteroidaceae bacterium]MBR1378221.1 DUF4290 domain-containing protein [Bacteroidaceae bacterium]